MKNLLTVFIILLLSSIVLIGQHHVIDVQNTEFSDQNQNVDDLEKKYLELNEINGKIWVNDSIGFFDAVNENDWTPTGLYKVLTRNDYGKKTSGVRNNIDYSLFEWVPVSKDSITYYNNNTEKTNLRMDWNSDAKKFSDTSSYNVSDDAGNIILSFYRNGSYGSKYLYTYDSNNNETFGQKFKWNKENKTWGLSWERTTEYNNEGVRIERIYKSIDTETNDLVNDAKFVYSVENNKISNYIYYNWDESHLIWVNYKKKVFYL